MALRTLLITAALPLCGLSIPSLQAQESATITYWRFEDAPKGRDAVHVLEAMGQDPAALSGGPAYHRPDGSSDVPVEKIPNPDPGFDAKGRNARSVRLIGPRDVDGERIGSDYLIADTVSGLDFGEGQAFTIEGWVKLESLPQQESGWHLVTKYGSPPEQIGYAVSVNFEGKLIFRIKTPTGGKSVTSEAGIAVGQWTHFAARRNSFGDIDVFLDGKLRGTESASAESLANDSRLFLGARDEHTLSSHLDGWLDEIRISNTALDPKDFLFRAE